MDGGRGFVFGELLFYAGSLVGLFLGYVAGKTPEPMSSGIIATVVAALPFLLVAVGIAAWFLFSQKKS